jgi:aminomethyltransferase
MKTTRLHDKHTKLNGRMIEFFGWEMPVEYSGIMQEHLAVRNRAGLFDVSHMGEILVEGPRALEYVQHLTPNNAARTNPEKAQYSALTTPEGTFVDDLLVYCLDETRYLLVVNAANTEKDFEWIRSHSGGYDVSVENLSDRYSQLALQGRKAVQILQAHTPADLDALGSFSVVHTEVAGVASMVSRTGYTGEDGFEIYTQSETPGIIWDALMETGEAHGLIPIGLGARDTLRLEACLMLYGNDIDDTTTALEAGLRWLVKFKKGDFLGREALLRQKEEGLTRRLAGFEIVGRGIARSHYPVLVGGSRVGEVTSGTFSPFLKKSIGLAYLPIGSTEVGTDLEVEIRGKPVPARVVEIPFYKRDY